MSASNPVQPFSITPALFRWERENHPPSAVQSGDGAKLGDASATEGGRTLFPLPAPVFAFGFDAAGFVAPQRSGGGRERVRVRENGAN